MAGSGRRHSGAPHGDDKPGGRPRGHLRSRLPIQHRSEDRLGRGVFAEVLAERIERAPFHRILAIEGPEKSGKTSVVNMTVEALLERDSDWEILHLSPEMFSGTEEQMPSFFFADLSAQLGEKSDRLRRIGRHLVEYGQLLGAFGPVPVVGTAFTAEAALSRGALNWMQRRENSEPPCANSQRAKLSDMLLEHGGRFLVIIDNLDRLTADEAGQLLRLVRVVADFPNTTYLLVYCRERMKELLADDSQDLLQHLVRVTYSIPPPLASSLSQVISDAIDAAAGGVDHGPFDRDGWPELFTTSIRPLIGSLLDVQRYASEVGIAVRVVGTRVALEDVLALEAMRLFAPASFSKLHQTIDVLTGTGSGIDGGDAQGRRGRVEELIAAAGPHAEAIREMCTRLFPFSLSRPSDPATPTAGQLAAWKRHGRVANPDVLRIYLETVLHIGFDTAQAAATVSESLADTAALGARLDALDAPALEEAVERVAANPTCPADQVESALAGLLNARGRLPAGQTNRFEVPAAAKLTQAAARLLRGVPVTSEREAIIERVLPRLEHLSDRQALLDLVRGTTGPKLVSDQVVKAIDEDLRLQVLATPTADLASEHDLFGLFAGLFQPTDEVARQQLRRVIDNDEALDQLLRSSVSAAPRSTASPALPPDAVSREPDLSGLPWDALYALFGEDHVRQRVAERHAPAGNVQASG